MSLLRDRIKESPEADLQQVLQFFDCDGLRAYYSGLIADVKSELARRSAATSGAGRE